MKTVETNLPIGRILEIKAMPDGSFKIVQEVIEVMEKVAPETKISGDDVIFIEAEELSICDKFMQYEPRTRIEKDTKELISEAICKKVKNFYHLKYDPSFTTDARKICFMAGKEPAVGKSYNWWVDVANEYNSKRNSRLGTRLQYGAFLGVLIKKLVEEGKPIEWAWNAVCNDSCELGHYRNSENAKHAFEPTGSRDIYGFCDLANTYKILAEDIDASGFWLAGAYYHNLSSYFPIAILTHFNCRNFFNNFGVGWLVLS